MKSSFKSISESIANDTLPDRATVDSFLADSELMVTYPGYGDEHYSTYTQVYQKFSQAYQNSDLGATLGQYLHQALPDETGGAGNQYLAARQRPRQAL